MNPHKHSQSASRRADSSKERKLHGTAVDDDKARLGRAILDTIKDLNDLQYLERFRLYAGLEPEPIPIHHRRVEPTWELPDSCRPYSIAEEYYIGTDGSLHLHISGYRPDPQEGLNSPDSGGDTELKTPEDFRKLSYGSVASLHEAVTSEGFFDKLAFRLSRRGKPGYGDIWALDAEKGLKNLR